VIIDLMYPEISFVKVLGEFEDVSEGFSQDRKRRCL